MKQKLILLTVLLTALTTFSAEYYVNVARSNNGGNGTSWEKAKKTIQAAVDLTVSGDTVWVTNGTYVLSSEISVTKAITIRSINGSDVTIVDGNGVFGCFSLNDSACTVSGFTIKNGQQGVRCADTTPVVVNCVITTNRVGGGMFRGTAQNCIFRGNEATDGGGMAEGKSYNCTFIGNVANPVGGAIGANGYGGGQYGGEAHGCLFIDNTAGMGLGCAFGFGTAYNCTFITVPNVNVGVYRSVVYNSVFSSETSAYDASEFYNSCASDLISGVNGNITNAPLFVDAANSNFRLQADSPCINAGNNSYVSNTRDLDGNPRIVHGVVDMGAYEVSPRTYYVDASRLDDSGDGLTWATAKQTIQAAVDICVAEDTVFVTNGIYNTGSAVTPGGTLPNRVVATNAIVIRSMNGPAETFIQGQGPAGSNAVRGVFLSGGAQLIGFTVENGATLDSTGLDGCGAGIFGYSGSVVSNCVLRSNASYDMGGGLYLNLDGNLVCNSTIESNQAAGGGGVAFGAGGTSVASNCRIIKNQAVEAGGGVFLYHSGTLKNCLIAGNAATNQAGGVWVDAGSGGVYIVNCTIAGNRAPNYGGLNYVVSGATVRNSVIWGNTNGNWNGGDYTYCLTTPRPSGAGNIIKDPLFADASCRLGPKSPCINAGMNDYAVGPVDLDGKPRVVSGKVDIGAYESDPSREYTLTVIGGTGGGTYKNGKKVKIQATVPSGWKFLNWDDGATETSRTIIMPPAPVTYTANLIDMRNPAVVITYPEKSQRVMTNGVVAIRGTAVDNDSLDRVMYQLSTGEWTNAVTTNGWENWTAEFSPVAGRNTVRAYSVDRQGNSSASAAVVFTYVPGASIEVQTNGIGTITPAYNGQVLEIGKSYKMTARAVKNSQFINWTYGIGGSVAKSKPDITFVMQSNLVLTANFRSLREEKVANADTAVALPATSRVAIVVDGSAKDWANVPCSSFSYASVTQEVAVVLDGNNIALLLNGCPFNTSDSVLVYFKLRLSYGDADNRHSVDLWTSGSVLYGMVDGQVIAGLEAVLLNGILEVKLPVAQAPSQVTIEEVACGMDLGGGTLTELFRISPAGQ